MKRDAPSPCRLCKHRHGERNLYYPPGDLLCTECVPLPPEGFVPSRVGYKPENGQRHHARKTARKVRRPCRTEGCLGTVTQCSRSGLCVACTIRAMSSRQCPLCGKAKPKHCAMCAECRKPRDK